MLNACNDLILNKETESINLNMIFIAEFVFEQNVIKFVPLLVGTSCNLFE